MYNMTCVIDLQRKCSLAISKLTKVKTWTMLYTFIYVFWHDTSNKKAVLSQGLRAMPL